jgi:hypothetical protein
VSRTRREMGSVACASVISPEERGCFAQRAFKAAPYRGATEELAAGTPGQSA